MVLNNPGRISDSGVIHVGMSDHSMTYGIFGKKTNLQKNENNNKFKNNQKHRYKTSRCLKKIY